MEPAVPLIQVTQELEALKLRLASMESEALNLEDNAAMVNGMLRLGFRPYKTYRIYDRAL